MTSKWGAYPKYGEYRIVQNEDGSARLLGEGSFGKTFQAVRSDTIAGREIKTHVALKVLNPQHLQDERKRSQLICEVEALTQVDHPNLIRYIGCGEEQGEIFYAMGLCRGGSLASLVERFGALPERAAAMVALQVAGGLRELGRRNMVHRDIKPSNVMLAEEIDPALQIEELPACLEAHESLIRLVDFGLVNLQEDDEHPRQGFAGSPTYASPEQLREQPLDARSDIYSLGMTLWHLVEGRGPFLDATGTTVATVADAVCRHLAQDDFNASLPSHLSGEFKRLLAQMIAKKRDERMANAADLLRALRGYLSRTAVIPVESAIEAPLTFATASKPLDALFSIGKALSSKHGRKSYEALDRAAGQTVRLTLLASAPEDQHGGVAERHLEQLASVTRAPDCPACLLKVASLLKSDGQIACVEPLFSPISLSEVLKARSAARRPASFSEAAPLLRPIAEGLDYLLEHGNASVLLRSDDIWLRPMGGAAPDAATMPAHFKDLDVRFSAMFLPPELIDENQEALGTGTGSLALSADDHHPVAAFARLVYRIVNGSEVPAVARLSPDGYPPTVALNAASNTLLRDCINRRKVTRTASLLLKSLCAQEGVLLSDGAGAKPAAKAFLESAPTLAASTVAGSGRQNVTEPPRAAPPPLLSHLRAVKSRLSAGAMAAAFAGFCMVATAAMWMHAMKKPPVLPEAPASPAPQPVASVVPAIPPVVPPSEPEPEAAKPEAPAKPEPEKAPETVSVPQNLPPPQDDSGSYFPFHAGDRSTFKVVMTTEFGGAGKCLYEQSVLGVTQPGPLGYFRVRFAFSLPTVPPAVWLMRKDSEGVHFIAENGVPDQIWCPFPVQTGRKWSYKYFGGVKSVQIAGRQTAWAGGQQYDNCWRIDTKLRSGPFTEPVAEQMWFASGVGMVKAIWSFASRNVTGIELSERVGSGDD